ncbi:MAG: glycosyltransferase involved in cell wall biosynthesis [Desulforhopalus sp.]|jgi:glycosyltransferase involved in cell wall biosynthesis
MKSTLNIKALYLNWFGDQLISYVCLRLIKYINDENVYATLLGIVSDSSIDPHREALIKKKQNGKLTTQKRSFYKDTFPRFLRSIVYRFLSNEKIKKIVELRFLKTLHSNDIAYLFPGTSLHLYEQIKKVGCTIIVERINTLRCHSKRLLDAETIRMNMSAQHDITERSATEEVKKMQLADYIFSPSPAVTFSIQQAGIDSEKILETSYGMDPKDILDVSDKVYGADPINIIFVGRICLRKGVHLLLDAWQQANIAGKLTLVGNIAPDFKEFFLPYLEDSTISHVSFVDDLRPLYRDADIFVLPSLEEGSPLVTYLALGASLPMIVSTMGGGGIVRDSIEGLVIDPHDTRTFADALLKLANDPKLRQRMSASSGKSALNYTWDQVGARRKELLKSKISN